MGSDGRGPARADRAHDTAQPYPGAGSSTTPGRSGGATTAIVRELLAAVPEAEPAGLGVSGIGPTLLPADADGRPPRPAILYDVDTRAGAP